MDELKRTLANITKNITKVSGDFIKTTKINLAITSEEDRLKSVYIDIGKKVHEIYMFGGSIGKFFDEKYQEINEIENKLSGLREQLNIASGTKACPKCKKTVDKHAEFCPKCGTKMDIEIIAVKPVSEITSEVNAEPQKTEDAEALPAPQKVCSSCGASCDSGDKYCLSCGRML